MGQEPDQTRRRTTVPSPLALWTHPVWHGMPSPAVMRRAAADARRAAVDAGVDAQRVKVAAAGFVAAATVSVMAPTMSTAQDTGANQEWAQSDDSSPMDVPGITKEATGLKRKRTARKVQTRGSVRRASTHRMVDGQSLWWLARKRLGPNASDAQVYRYLVKVWNKNDVRIGTGDPNLVKAGTVLRLPPVTRAA